MMTPIWMEGSLLYIESINKGHAKRRGLRFGGKLSFAYRINNKDYAKRRGLQFAAKAGSLFVNSQHT